MAEKGRYTKYSNKIGLYSNSKGSFLKNDTDVVLNFPFKDAVLEAGMSKEDVGREERFLHIELDSKDIDTLEEPKVLSNFRYVDKDGEKPLTADSDIEFFHTDNNLRQNLLIKGNNLLALYTLRKRLAGQVKLIYIDPPYNTGNDGFRYNDNFNHSAWLAFMKNRLEVAKDLLREDGAIFISCDDNEQAYLKVLADEIFGKDNFIATTPWRKRTAKSDVPFGVSQDFEWIVGYAKSADFQARIEGKGRKYYQTEDLPNRPWRVHDLTKQTTSKERPNSFFTIINPKNGKEYPANPNRTWAITHETFQGYYDKQRIVFPGDYDFLKISKPALRYFEEDDKEKAGENHGYVAVSTLLPQSVGMTKEGTAEITQLLGSKLFAFPKPEGLISHLISIATEEGDLVLDFCLGSGTTSAVAHKMNRHWVGIEQMDYIEDVAKERLKKVVDGEQGGISKSVEWKGGGSFVCLELKKYNQEYVERIMKATSLSALEDLYVDMRNNAFLKFWFDRKDFEKDENFRNLDIEKRKQKLVDVLDENQLYLNNADMGDTRHNVSSDERRLTDKFYGTSEN